uniref:Uncharacterized protein n=1 Tax=Ananas comosus var. bracteatus TaxID=296719 RepID=A0A6V7QT54_ANACO
MWAPEERPIGPGPIGRVNQAVPRIRWCRGRRGSRKQQQQRTTANAHHALRHHPPLYPPYLTPFPLVAVALAASASLPFLGFFGGIKRVFGRSEGKIGIFDQGFGRRSVARRFSIQRQLMDKIIVFLDRC